MQNSTATADMEACFHHKIYIYINKSYLLYGFPFSQLRVYILQFRFFQIATIFLTIAKLRIGSCEKFNCECFSQMSLAY